MCLYHVSATYFPCALCWMHAWLHCACCPLPRLLSATPAAWCRFCRDSYARATGLNVKNPTTVKKKREIQDIALDQALQWGHKWPDTDVHPAAIDVVMAKRGGVKPPSPQGKAKVWAGWGQRRCLFCSWRCWAARHGDTCLWLDWPNTSKASVRCKVHAGPRR